MLRYGGVWKNFIIHFFTCGHRAPFNNMVILFFLGAMIEKVTGHLQFLILYLLSGIGANICSLIYKVIAMERIASVGASGAIFGLDGVLLAWILLDRRSMPDVTPKRVILMIALSLYNGFTAQNVDNAAHVGGLLTGFLAGALLCMIRKQKKKSRGVDLNINIYYGGRGLLMILPFMSSTKCRKSWRSYVYTWSGITSMTARPTLQHCRRR